VSPYMSEINYLIGSSLPKRGAAAGHDSGQIIVDSTDFIQLLVYLGTLALKMPGQGEIHGEWKRLWVAK